MSPEKLLDQFSTHLKNTIARSISLAQRLDHTAVTPLHLLAALTEEPGAVGGEVLRRLQIVQANIDQALHQIPKLASGHSTTLTLPALNIAAKKALERAMLLAYEYEHTYVGSEHLLYGIIHSDDSAIADIIHGANLHLPQIDDEIEQVLQGASRFPDIEQLAEEMMGAREPGDGRPLSPRVPSPGNGRAQKQPRAIDVFTTNLTSKEAQKNIDPVVGRAAEIERLVHILCRRTKNNPLLIGEPGVGKTAIVEGLAKRIADGNVPGILRHKKILSLDLTLLVAGTIYRGEFEARLKQIIEEVSHSPDIILFIDEIHNVVGAGSNQGTMDAANILKPALARGQLHCIGATTIDEYQKHLAHDPALERRFQIIRVEEPSAADAIQILSGLAPYYEAYHSVHLSPEAISTAVELSAKYIHEHYLPDKAIDLIDEAAAALRAKQPPQPIEEKIYKLEAELERVRVKKEQTIAKERLEDALVWKAKETALQKKIQLLKKNQPQKNQVHDFIGTVLAGDIVQALGRRLSIDPKRLHTNEWELLANLPTVLKQDIIGQDKVIETIAHALERARLRRRDDRKPLASFLFTGPSGVGKTELAKQLARALYHDEKALIAFTMSEFTEAHSISKLLGSPAGYVGYKERNRFTDELRKRPHAVVLFDEFDKAHPDVQKILYQILDEGQLVDSQGKAIHFREAIIILTTNCGAELYKSAGIGFDTPEKQQIISDTVTRAITQKLKDELGGALLGRIGSVCLFAPLGITEMATIVRQRLERLGRDLPAHEAFTIVSQDEATTSLAKRAYSPDTGARHVDNIIRDTVHDLMIPILKKKKRKKVYTLQKMNDVYKMT